MGWIIQFTWFCDQYTFWLHWVFCRDKKHHIQFHYTNFHRNKVQTNAIARPSLLQLEVYVCMHTCISSFFTIWLHAYLHYRIGNLPKLEFLDLTMICRSDICVDIQAIILSYVMPEHMHIYARTASERRSLVAVRDSAGPGCGKVFVLDSLVHANIQKTHVSEIHGPWLCIAICVGHFVRMLVSTRFFSIHIHTFIHTYTYSHTHIHRYIRTYMHT